ncbi:MAG: invasion associated locus B family protein [Hyphomicrobiales bacterium]|nr:invasion associated locus B family protein [Hyphomicrobiales bacterium]
MSFNAKLAGAVVAASLAMAGNAFAQAAPKAAPKAAQPAPAQPAAPAQQGEAAPQQPQGPIKVDLKAVQADWTKICDPEQKKLCYTTRDFATQLDQPPVLAVAVYDIKGDANRVMRLLLPVGLMLKPGFRASIDGGKTMDGTYELCFPNGCFGEVKLPAATLEAMKKGHTLHVAVRNQMMTEVTFNVPLEGFGKGFDGPAIDPKVLEAQQKALQEQLEKKAKEQREQLEKQGGAPAAGGAAPAPAAPAAPK